MELSIVFMLYPIHFIQQLQIVFHQPNTTLLNRCWNILRSFQIKRSHYWPFRQSGFAAGVYFHIIIKELNGDCVTYI